MKLEKYNCFVIPRSYFSQRQSTAALSEIEPNSKLPFLLILLMDFVRSRSLMPVLLITLSWHSVTVLHQQFYVFILSDATSKHERLINRWCHNINTRSTLCSAETFCIFITLCSEVFVWFRGKEGLHCWGVMQSCFCPQRPWQIPTARSRTLISQTYLRWTQKLSRRRSLHIDGRSVIISMFIF